MTWVSNIAKSGRIVVKITPISFLILQKKTKYADIQLPPSSGLEILGNTSSTVQYSVVGDTTNMEYSVVTVSSQVSQIVTSSSESKSEIILKE